MLPVLRSCLDAYDPEADGISREELLELVQTCACDEDDLSLAEGACDACFGRSALGGETFTVDAVFDACQHEDPPLLLAELKRQLGRFRAAYLAKVAQVDGWVGQLLDALPGSLVARMFVGSAAQA